jgi:hypothetical protein
MTASTSAGACWKTTRSCAKSVCDSRAVHFARGQSLTIFRQAAANTARSSRASTWLTTKNA